MSKKYRKFFKKAVSYILTVVLCINMVFYSMASAESKIGSNEVTTQHGTLEITSDSIIIDGNVYSKAQFAQALQQLKQLTEQQNSTKSNVQSRIEPSLAFVGMGLSGVFAKIAFTLAMAGLFTYAVGKVYVVLMDALPGLSRRIEIEIRDRTSVYIDGIKVGINWVTLETVEYLAANHASIEEVTEEEGDGDAESEVTSADVDWDVDDNLKNHVANGSNGNHREPWKKFGLDPDDPNFYSLLLPYLKKVVDEGTKYKEIVVENGKVLFYIKNFAEKGQEIIVKIYVENEGLIKKLSDAYINTR